MYIFNYINFTCNDDNFKGDHICIPQGHIINLNTFFSKHIEIAQIKKEEGENPSWFFTFRGDIDIKIGLLRHGYNFTWLYEHRFSASEWSRDTIQLDLSTFTDGILEINILGLQESKLSLKYPPHYQQIAESSINKEHILYQFISPTLELCCEEQIYYKFSGSGIYYSFEDSCVHMRKKTSADLLTYFNAFSACKWAKHTNIKQISAYIDFMGKAEVILVHKNELGERNLRCYSIESTKRATFELPIGAYPSTGLLGLRIFAYKDSTLFGGGWLSPDPETQSVKLGIGITTFKREEAVKAAVQRLSQAIISHPLYNTAIDISVVDNGQTLSPEDVKGSTLIPNKNLGGTGGFMRNLLHYSRDKDKFTHCLFMDDDASCEAESIFRSVSFMRHAKDASMAISGAMLSENIKFMQWENGAWFDKECHPLHWNYDLRNTDLILNNEQEEPSKPTYGAWWFFMFPIQHVTMYSFPFFVRGDDIEFSYTNKFNIIHINGVATWQEDFKIKESPTTLYFDTRSHILHHLVLEHIDHGPIYIIKMVWAFFYRYNWSYQYDTANAIATAFSDILEGQKYWIDNIDTSKIRAGVKQKYKIETSSPLRKKYKEIPEAKENIRLPFCTKFIRKITLNGHLLPECMVRKEMVRLNKYQIPFKNRVFLRDKILVCNEINKTEMVLKRNSRYFIKNIFRFFITSLVFLKKYRSLKKEYRTFMQGLKKDDFWQKIFS